MRCTEELSSSLRERGLKVTPQRRLIFQALEGNSSHPSAEDIYARVSPIMPTISLTTVYKTLKGLVEMKELQELDLGTGRTHYDPITGPHSHLVCLGCRKVVDIFRDYSTVMTVPPEEAQGFTLTRHQVILYGHCPGCSVG